MSLNAISDSAYMEIPKPDQKLPVVSATNDIPNISINDNPLPDTTGSKSKANQEEKEKGPLSNPEKQIQSEISKVNNMLKIKRIRFEYKYFEDIDRVAIKVLDEDTDEILQEIPPEKTIESIQKWWELAGLLYDKKC
jgi:Uncharacterized flagellar protein FlaG